MSLMESIAIVANRRRLLINMLSGTLRLTQDKGKTCEILS